jgi:putative MATE family efflux protein
MMIFSSIYGIVDGFFVSNFAGKTPFAAVNFIMPFLMILGAFGFVFGTGGSAIVSKTLGEGDAKKANSLFSMITYISIIVGVPLAAIGIVLIRPIAAALGAEGEMLELCVIYGRIILVALPAFMLQMEFQSFFVTAEKPSLGLLTTVAAGVANMVLDALFIAVFRWGIVGAALATAISQVVGGLLPILYFSCKNKSLLRLTKFKFDGRALLKTCTNGSSELMTNISMSVVGMLYNIQLMKYAGENGVAAYGVLMYVSFVFQSVFIGYIVGMAPIVGFHYGAQNDTELKSLLKKSVTLISIASVLMFFAGELLARPFSVLFVGYDSELLSLTSYAFSIFSFAFLFSGFSIFGSSFFTALSDGLTSALISFLRTLVFQVAAIIIFPLVWDIDGIWWSIVAAEVMAVLVTLFFLIIKRKKYKYM